jgi:hypothetical protein
MLFFGFAEAMAYMSVMLNITSKAPQAHLGLAHGFASTMSAFIRTISPASTGFLWEWGRSSSFPGFVFLIGSFSAGIGILASYMLP